MRRLLPREALATRGPLLGAALLMVLGAAVLFGLGYDYLAVGALLVAFAATAASKRSS